MNKVHRKTTKINAPIILYELNEVPWRVFDWYIKQRPGSYMAKLFNESGLFTTRTHDNGELHPWSTWPSLHRGVYNTTHHINFINQDLSCAEEFPPLWQTLMELGIRVGVFGSMQSWPVPVGSKYCFYIPDTFAQTPETQPKIYSAYQSLNLRQTRADGAVTQSVQLNSNMFTELARLPFIGVRFITFMQLTQHLINEKIDSRYRSRRALMQAPLSFDVFLHAYKKTKPEFCTFFTNHVAGAMHRYWKYAFPEDFNTTLQTDECIFKCGTLMAAMEIANSQIGELMRLLKQDRGQLIVATSMGQEAIDRGTYSGELRLMSSDRLMQSIGFKHPFKDMLAMQPDFNFKFESLDNASEFIELASCLRSPKGRDLWFSTVQEGCTVNMSMGIPEDAMSTGTLIIVDKLVKSKILRHLRLDEVGISHIDRDPGTGYHQPLGCLIWHGSQNYLDKNRLEIESIDVRKMILEEFSSRVTLL